METKESNQASAVDRVGGSGEGLGQGIGLESQPHVEGGGQGVPSGLEAGCALLSWGRWHDPGIQLTLCEERGLRETEGDKR